MSEQTLELEEAIATTPALDKKCGVGTAEKAAEIFLKWAQENRLVGEEIPLHLNIENDIKDDLFGRLKISPTAETIFRHRQIKFVAFNQEEKAISIYTLKKITNAEIKDLPSIFNFDTAIRVNYFYCGAIQASMPDNTSSSPYYELNGKYCCGSSIHPARHIGAGTLGCLVMDDQGNVYGLTNNHVSGMCNYANAGEKIIAPGHIDINAAGIDPFTIGYHYRSLPFASGVPDNITVSENIDAALFALCDKSKVSSYQGRFYDTPNQVSKICTGMEIEKVGRSTGHTKGFVISSIVGSINVSYSVPGIVNQLAYFENVFVAKGLDNAAFSEAGDSGSLVTTIIDGVRSAVGIVFAGNASNNPPLSFILPIDVILEKFGVTLLSNHNLNEH